MANPITWKNINSPASSAGSVNARSGAMDSARSAFEGMSRSFEGAIKRQQGIRADNRENTIDNNTQGFKDLMSQYSSPDEIEAAREQGVFDNYLAEKGQMIDQDVANRGAVDSRVTGLREAQTAERAYDLSEQKFGNRDALAEFNGAIAARDVESAQRIWDETNFSNPGELQKQITGVQDWQRGEDRRLLEQGRDDQTYNRNEATRAQTEAANTLANTTISNAQASYESKEEGILSLANELGMPMTEGGAIDYDNTSPSLMANFDKRMNELDLTMPSDTELGKQAMEEHRLSFPNATQAELEAVKNNVYIGLTETMAPEDQGRLNSEVRQLGETLDMPTNPFMQQKQNPESNLDAALRITQSVTGPGGVLEGRNERNVSKTITDVIALAGSKSIEVGGEKISIPPQIIEMAINASTERFWRPDISAEEAYKGIIDNIDLEGLYQSYLDYEKGVSDLTQTALGQAGLGDTLGGRVTRWQDAAKSIGSPSAPRGDAPIPRQLNPAGVTDTGRAGRDGGSTAAELRGLMQSRSTNQR